MDHSHPVSTYILQTTSAAAIISAIIGYLPPITAIVALLWYVIQISESRPVRRWKHRRHTVKLARLKARIMLMEAKILPLPEELKDFDEHTG